MDSLGTNLAFIEGLGGPEMVLILVIVLVLFGGEKLPGFARGMGKSIREFKKAASGVEEEFKRALEEDEKKSTPTTPVPTILPPQPPAVSHVEPPPPTAQLTSPADPSPTSPTPIEPSAPATPTPPAVSPVELPPAKHGDNLP